MKNASLYFALTGATSMAKTPSLGDIIVSNDQQNFAASLATEVVGYLAGLPSPDEEESLNLLAPLLMTGDFFNFPKAADEAFLTEIDGSDIRAIGGSFKRIEHRGTKVTLGTDQKGLTERVDHRTIPVVNGQRVAGWENRTARGLMNRLTRADKYRALGVIDGAANNNNVVWDAAGNPDADIRAMVQRTRTKTGRLPTHLVVGSAAQMLRQDSYEDAARANHAMARHSEWTMEQLAAYASAGRGYVETGLIQTKKGAAKIDQLGLAVYSYSALAEPSINDPSNIKRTWSPTLSGGRWAVFIQEGAAWTDITVFHQTKIFAPQTAGIEKLTPAAA
ncbi:hypothetical protein [Haloferula sargassicola]|uniref:Major capsid protein n=1 Tax=Haloferula sargassicola TaxID=490096 RepID=A0ABP9UKL2_9BACT